MEYNQSIYQPPRARMVETHAGVVCSSFEFTTDDSTYIDGDWEE